MMNEKEKKHIPKNLLLQWHVTERCNLRCKHCYHTKYGRKELPIERLLDILDQYKDLLGDWRRQKKVSAHINITGGEPFVRDDFFVILEMLHANRDIFSYAILTNGTLINGEVARRLKKVEPKFVQVSIEGTRENHDRIRGEGSFDKALAGIKALNNQKIPVLISFTAHKGNLGEFKAVARLAKKMGASGIWSDRLIPSGSGKKLLALSPEETCDFVHELHDVKKELSGLFRRTEVKTHRALQFHGGGGRPYRCSAGDSLVTVQANGDLYPCRRMPIKVGNLLKKDLAELYYADELFRKLRDRETPSKGCEKCFYARLCDGGLKCLSYAVYKDPFRKDPGCWVEVGK